MKAVALLCVFSFFVITGCRGVGGALVVGGGYPHIEHAPPAHAPAHGRRLLHRYQYYPNAEFYFDVGRNLYFYLDLRGHWAFSVNLPHHLTGYLQHGYVEIEMESDRPYSRHKYHKNKYKKHKYRKNKHRKKQGRHRGDDDEGGRDRRGRGYEHN